MSAVEAFLGRVQDGSPRAGDMHAHADGALRTIMFTDIVGSTEITARVGDLIATELVRAHDAIVRRALRQCGGREVKHTGDGIMASFDVSQVAVDCAKRIIDAFNCHNLRNSQPICVRIGLDAGQPVSDSNDLFGSTVQLAVSSVCGSTAQRDISIRTCTAGASESWQLY
jgi:class 3 adenylate cyclase